MRPEMTATPLTTGIRPRFPTVKSYLKSYVLGPTPYDEVTAHLTAYGQGNPVVRKNPFTRQSEVYGIINAHTDLGQMVALHYWQSIHAALGGTESAWEMAWRQAVATDYWETRVNYAWHLHALEEFEHGKRVQKLRMMLLRNVGFCLGNCLSLGWFDYARGLAESCRIALEKGFFVDGTSEGGTCCRVQYFVLRLLADWQHRPLRLEQGCAYDEPLYESLLQNWRNPDVGVVAPLLLAACDKHTYLAQLDKKEETFDLAYYSMWYVPFEVLSVLRLRQNLGLSVPALDHLLTNTPLGQLGPVTEPYTDALLTSVVGAITKQLPQMKMP